MSTERDDEAFEQEARTETPAKLSRQTMLRTAAKAGIGLTAIGVLSAELAGTAEASSKNKYTVHTSILKLGMPAAATKLLTPTAAKLKVGDLFLISQGDVGLASMQKINLKAAQLTAADVQSVQACLSMASYKAVLKEAKGTPYYQAIQSNVAAGAASPTGCISACTSTTCNVSCKNGAA